MGKVIKFRGGIDGAGCCDEPVESLVEALKFLLAEAEAGRLRGMLASLLTHEDGVGSCIVGSMKYYTALGSLEDLKMEFASLQANDVGLLH